VSHRSDQVAVQRSDLSDPVAGRGNRNRPCNTTPGNLVRPLNESAALTLTTSCHFRASAALTLTTSCHFRASAARPPTSTCRSFRATRLLGAGRRMG